MEGNRFEDAWVDNEPNRVTIAGKGSGEAVDGVAVKAVEVPGLSAYRS